MKPKKQSAALKPLDGVQVTQSDIHGLGVFTTRAFRKGEAIGPYLGRRYTGALNGDEWDGQLTYLFSLSDGSTIDGAQGGNATRHINHACDPNVEAIEVEDEAGALSIEIHALRRLKAGEELFLDYALEIDGDDPMAYACHCGSPRCRGSLSVVAPAG